MQTIILSMAVMCCFNLYAYETHQFECDDYYNNVIISEIGSTLVANPRYVISISDTVLLQEQGRDDRILKLERFVGDTYSFFVKLGFGEYGPPGVNYRLTGIDKKTESAQLEVVVMGGFTGGSSQKMNCLYLSL